MAVWPDNGLQQCLWHLDTMRPCLLCRLCHGQLRCMRRIRGMVQCRRSSSSGRGVWCCGRLCHSSRRSFSGRLCNVGCGHRPLSSSAWDDGGNRGGRCHNGRWMGQSCWWPRSRRCSCRLCHWRSWCCDCGRRGCWCASSSTCHVGCIDGMQRSCSSPSCHSGCVVGELI